MSEAWETPSPEPGEPMARWPRSRSRSWASVDSDNSRGGSDCDKGSVKDDEQLGRFGSRKKGFYWQRSTDLCSMQLSSLASLLRLDLLHCRHNSILRRRARVERTLDDRVELLVALWVRLENPVAQNLAL